MISYLLSHSMNRNYNIRVAKIFGLMSAVYLSLMLSEQCDAIEQKKLYKDKYFSYSRDQIYNETTLCDDKQKDIEDNLIECQVLSQLPFSNNRRKFYYFIDENKLQAILDNYKEDDIQYRMEAKKAKPLLVEKAAAKVTRKQQDINAAMSVIIEKDQDVYNLYAQWVDTMITKYGYCAKTSLKLNAEDLNKYSNGNKEVKIGVLRIAAKNGWKDIQYSINNYDANKKKINLRNSQENSYQVKESSSQKDDAIKAVEKDLRSGSNVF